jgi:hypothetical protein
MGFRNSNKIDIPHYEFTGEEKEFKTKMKGHSISEIAISLYEKYSNNGHLERNKDFEKELGYAKNIVMYDRLPKLKEDIKQILYWLKDNTQKKTNLEKKIFVKNNFEKLEEIDKDFKNYIKKETKFSKKANPDCERLEKIINNDKKETADPQVDLLRNKELAITYIKMRHKENIPDCIIIKEVKHPKRFGEKVGRKYIQHMRTQSKEYKSNVVSSHSVEEMMKETYLRINDIMGIQLVYSSCKEKNLKRKKYSPCQWVKQLIIKSEKLKKWEVKDFFKEPKGKFNGSIKLVIRPLSNEHYHKDGQIDYCELQITDCDNLIKGEVGEHSHAAIYETRQKQFEKELSRKEKPIYDELSEIAEEIIRPYWDFIMESKGKHKR